MKFPALLLASFSLMASISACTPWPEPETAAPVAASGPSAPLGRGQKAVLLAQDQVGAPYLYGGHSPQGFDCSGLVYYVYGRLGVNLPRTALAQYDHTRRVTEKDLQPGDLVFFLDAGHVGIYVGDGWFIHAPETGKPVEGAWLNVGYWHQHYFGAGRP